GPAVPLAVELLRCDSAGSLLRLTFTEGRKHEVKRYCEALGHRVQRLRRIAFGPLALGALPAGGCRPLTPREIAALRKTAADCGGSALADGNPRADLLASGADFVLRQPEAPGDLQRTINADERVHLAPRRRLHHRQAVEHPRGVRLITALLGEAQAALEGRGGLGEVILLRVGPREQADRFGLLGAAASVHRVPLGA